MRTLFEIYFGINLLCAGYNLSDEWRWHKTIIEKLKALANVILTSLFYLPYIILLLLYVLFLELWKKIDTKEKYTFLFKFYFSTAYHNLDKRVLWNINDRLLPLHQSDSDNDKFWRKWIVRINKRNNYTYNPAEPPTEDEEEN